MQVARPCSTNLTPQGPAVLLQGSTNGSDRAHQPNTLLQLTRGYYALQQRPWEAWLECWVQACIAIGKPKGQGSKPKAQCE